MDINVKELSELTNMINRSNREAFKEGKQKEIEREKPNTLFDSLLEYAKKSKTLVDYQRSNDLNWIQIKPTRDGSEGIKHIEIGFDVDGMGMDFVGIEKE